MSGDDDDFEGGSFASPPCFMHELDPTFLGLEPASGGGGPTAEEHALLGRALLEELPDAVILSDADGVIRHWNAGAVRIFGFAADEAVGQSLDIIIPERLRARHWDGYRRMMATGRSSHGPEEVLSVPATTKSGDSISVQFTLAPVRDRDGRITGLLALLRDATETFRELKRLRAAAHAAKDA